MISQADIIRSLLNKNCTDESIMSVALSPDCTLPKLLQKVTEAERFDLALDVYMKLGMDVVPLWKTWALRCLKNRDFQAARDKFRHCFQRFRSSAGRFGAATNSLLEDILNVLIRMKETKLPLSEEVELIKNSKKNDRHLSTRDNATSLAHTKINETKPKLLSECMYYLKEYGTTELLIKFYVDNELWNEAIKTLFDTRGASKDDSFFISHIVSPSEANGHLDQVIYELLRLDPHINSTSRYFEALYHHLAKRHNTLYYMQHVVGDHIRAAENQVRNFFLRKPCQDYKELNQRLPSLLSASEEYSEYLKKLNERPGHNQSEFIAQLSRDEIELRLGLINTQIEVTRNFQINEVPGCINGIEVVVPKQAIDDHSDPNDNSIPVTLFDECPRRQTFLAALILIYFDIDCSNYMSNSGFQLSNRLINETDLDKLSVFKTAMNIIIDDESSDFIENATLLLKRLREDYIACTQRAKLKPSVVGGETVRRASSISTTAVASATDSLSRNVISRPKESEKSVVVASRAKRPTQQQQPKSSSPQNSTPATNRGKKKVYNFEPPDKSVRPGSNEAARLLCDEVIRDAIRSCREEDYKMELMKLLSPEAKVVLYIELGKLSVAQRLASDMNRPDYVKMVLKEAERLNQDHVKDVCQHWLAKH